MTDMTAPDEAQCAEHEDPPKRRSMSREERKKRRAEIHAGQWGPEIEMLPEMQELRRSQAEYRARIDAIIRRIAGR